MTVLLRFTVPGPPVAKGRPRMTVRGGQARAYTPARTVAYEGLIALAGRDAMAGQQPFDQPLRVEIVATFAIPATWSKRRRAAAVEGWVPHVGRPDADNLLKAVGDGLNGVVWRDDALLASAEIAKRYGAVPGVTVTVVAL